MRKSLFSLCKFFGRSSDVFMLIVRGLIVLLFVLLPMAPQSALAVQSLGIDATWLDGTRNYRLQIVASASGVAHTNKPVEIPINFTTALANAGVAQSFDRDSMWLVEVDESGASLNPDPPFQFDPVADYDGASNAAGTLTFLLDGSTSAGENRYFQLYFDVGNQGFTPLSFSPQVTLSQWQSENQPIVDEGENSLKIETLSGTYFYHLVGGGFSSLNDSDGADWINYSTAVQHRGEYRGVPNLLPPSAGGYFHPGHTGVVTEVLSTGPLKASYRSYTPDGQREVVWDIFPQYARLTVVKMPANVPYWFLYEGTPGGMLTSGDSVVRSDGSVSQYNRGWCRDAEALDPLPADCNGENAAWSEEWAYFLDPDAGANGRSLFVASHQNDAKVDSYRMLGASIDDPMTVLGFGRNANTPELTATPTRFTFGLTNRTNFADVALLTRSAIRDAGYAVGIVEHSDNGPVEPSTVISDDFNQCALDTGLWAFIDPQAANSPSNYRQDGDQFEIAVPGGTSHDVWTSGIEAPYLLQGANNTDFTVEAKFTSSVDQPIQLQGLLVLKDNANWVRLNVQYDGTRTQLVAVRTTAGSPQIAVNQQITSGPIDGPIYLRLTRSGLNWQAAYSLDGNNWISNAQTSFFHGLNVTSVGVFAGNAGAAPAFTAKVDYFFNSAAPIEPEDAVANVLPVVLTGSGRGAVLREPVCGNPVHLSAQAEPGSRFVGYSGAVNTQQPDIEISFGRDAQVTAQFDLEYYALNVGVVDESGNPIEGPSVSVSPPTYPDGYVYDENVQLTAISAAGWRFVRWEGGVTGEANPAGLTMTRDETVNAIFAFVPVYYQITVTHTGDGSVTLDDPANPSGYVYGETVELTATAEPGSFFAGWSGVVESVDNPLSLVVEGDMELSAAFLPGPYQIEVTPTEGGSVTVAPPAYPEGYWGGESVAVEAMPQSGWTFIRWEGSLTGQNNPAVLHVDGDETLVAVFSQDRYRIDGRTVDMDGLPTDGCTLSFDPSPADGYLPGQEVTAHVTPASGWNFLHWEGDLSGTDNPATFTVDGNQNIIAVCKADDVVIYQIFLPQIGKP
ncbi:MAG: DUF1349 domain-containing protein [Caldilineaceae bacterium]|nr:DUF1349 domain-containing protein [Caldilineaceae bacterium]